MKLTQYLALRLSFILCALLAAGCANTDSGFKRDFPTGIDPGQTVTIFLWKYSVFYPPENDDIEIARSLLDCVYERSGNADFDLVRLSRPLVDPISPAQSAQYESKVESVLEFLRDERLAGNPELADVRYVMLLSISYWDTHYESSSGLSGPPGFFKGRNRTVNLTADVLDIANARIAGTVYANASGKRGGGLVMSPVVLPIPLFAYTDPASHACTDISDELKRFIAR